ncbi:flagellar motor switch protein FliN [Thiomicrorhabdus xiamenensis]|uniref:Flagellar motor switch protein FliN n=1 Tax=Thiomicrorhabdus xiamenensis TaxID=2739063 RepID=A0A7D4SNI8_9GAMM|nr:flagellar motor switch protein FliN [Thiomicrorhabdus xiamenensis]QKI89541.1 flagellar motor switch protein FliN [Thiomicrorhabdus xiamenensis]
MSEQDDLSAWDEALSEQAEAEGSAEGDSAAGDADDMSAWGDALNEQANASKADFEDIADSSASGKNKVDLDVLLDVPVTLQLEIGRAKVSIRNLLSYTQGSVVEMDRLAGEPLDLLVNGTLIAHGEVVVINDKFGVRLTDVVSPQERIRKLK